ncbi:MAG: DUF3604 domain-containing protein [Betaproteobacteria bacterium]|nr:DUF3604 domain-containing protein [Betaproteobacteria bacterium]
MKTNMRNWTIAGVCALMSSGNAQIWAQDVPGPADKKIIYSPYPSKTFPNRVYFGDTHLHTSYSADAGMAGAIVGPEDAYRFARGEEVKSNSGLPVKLSRPLDFLVIADHAENLGLAPMIAESDPALLKSEWGRKVHDLAKTGTIEGQGAAFNMWIAAMQELKDPFKGQEDSMARPAWKRLTAAAEKYNEPGRFSAIIGYEWTSGPDGNNLHRNVLFRDGKDKADQIIPLSYYDTGDPEDLWKWMAAYEQKTGGKVLAIPHNGNLSNGLMFDDVTLSTRKPLDRDYAERRMRWEPIYETTQPKGDGETHPALSRNDEFANFERWDKGSFGPVLKTPDMLPREYTREALKRGLAYEAKLGVNPFKFGLIGSTDMHTGLATTTEDNFFGKVAVLEPSADPIRFDEVIVGRVPADRARSNQHLARETSASGLAAVWARDNTREALWDAMARKEVYATTGTRLQVRVFGGFDFTAKDLERSDFAEQGYQRGVPMGGDLKAAPAGRAPTMLIRAMRDADGANLDRVQVVKGWLDAAGKTHEKIYDVAWSGNRKPGKDGKLPPVGNTVDVKEASYTNAIGAPYITAYWKDPVFDPKQRAFYYVRVLEIPTPRWTTFDAKAFGVKLPTDVPASIQERAYTSPIWYTP